jgi:hypothetical protein
MCEKEKVRHAWIYGGVCEIRPPVYTAVASRRATNLATHLVNSRNVCTVIYW